MPSDRAHLCLSLKTKFNYSLFYNLRQDEEEKGSVGQLQGECVHLIRQSKLDRRLRLRQTGQGKNETYLAKCRRLKHTHLLPTPVNQHIADSKISDSLESSKDWIFVTSGPNRFACVSLIATSLLQEKQSSEMNRTTLLEAVAC